MLYGLSPPTCLHPLLASETDIAATDRDPNDATRGNHARTPRARIYLTKVLAPPLFFMPYRSMFFFRVPISASNLLSPAPSSMVRGGRQAISPPDGDVVFRHTNHKVISVCSLWWIASPDFDVVCLPAWKGNPRKKWGAASSHLRALTQIPI